MLRVVIKRIAFALVFTPIIYLSIAATLTMWPVERYKSAQSLDFEVLDAHIVNQDFTRVYFAPDAPVATIASEQAESRRALFYRQLLGGDDLVFIVLHGSGSEGRYLLPLADQLNTTLGASVIIPDLRGHGESSLNKRGDIDYMDQYLDDLNALNIRLRQHFPKAKLILAGHSSGGGLAIKYGGHQSQDFDGYLLLAPYLGYQAPTIRENSGGWVQVSTRRYVGLSMLNNVAISALNHTPVLFFNRPVQVDDSLQVDHYSYRLNQSYSPHSYSGELSANSQPILLLVGQDDEAFYADKFADAVTPYAPQAKVQVLANLKHLDLPSHPETVKAITRWVNERILE